MGQTIAEKIFSKNINTEVYAGDEYIFTPDVIVAYDYPGYVDVFHKQMIDLGVDKVDHPERVVLVIDHFNPAGSAAEAAVHPITREFGKKFGYRVVEGKGIGHQVLTEMGYVAPGKLAVHFDGHISTWGALGALPLGISRAMTETFATQSISYVVPPTYRINIEGQLPKGVTARDAFNTILQRIGPCGANSCIVEYGGPGLHSLNMDERFTLCNLVMFIGGSSAIMEQDEVTIEYLNKYKVNWEETYAPDMDAVYEGSLTLDLNSVEPLLVAPPSPANSVSINDFIGRPIQAAYLGSCASGRLTDFKQMLEILEGKHVAEGFRLHAVPTSAEIQAQLAEQGIMQKLIRAGVMMESPSCDFCYGKLGVITEGETALSTGTLNVPGRMGSNKADIFIASPYTIAASALFGKITDPRTLL